LHTTTGGANKTNSKSDGFHSQQVPPPPPLFSEFNHARYQSTQPFTRNASTSTLDLDSKQKDCGVDEFTMKNNHRREMKISKDKSNGVGSGGHKMDFCGMLKSSKESPRMTKLRAAKNVYYIEDDTKDADTNIFIIDPHTIDKHKKFHHIQQKSLEDIRLHKMPVIVGGQCNEHDALNFMERNQYSRTLPRDHAIRRNLRPSLDNLLDNFYQQQQQQQPHPTTTATAEECER
jgi:hypothetical protein